MTAISRTAGTAPTGSAPRGITWWAGIGRVFEYRLLDYRRTYRSSIFNSFVGPALFLAAMGVGLGTYVNDSAALGGVSYLAFLAPGLLAATAMQTAAFESTFPIMGGLEWNRVYHAMFATPIRPERHRPRQHCVDRLPGPARVLGLRAGDRAVRGRGVALDRARDPRRSPDRPRLRRTDHRVLGDAAQRQYVQRRVPLRDHAAVPVLGDVLSRRSLPTFLQAVAWLTPLYHGVALSRALSLGYAAEEPLLMLAHAAILLAFITAGAYAAVRTFERKLVRG